MKIKRGVEKKPIPSQVFTDIKIFAADPASNFGWAMSREIYGVWDLSTRRDESMGMKLLRMKAKLDELYRDNRPSLIAYERAAGAHKASIIHEAKLIGLLESWCEEMGIAYRAYSAGEIKRFATGLGNASKEKMIEAAREKLGYKGNNDNEADALWILEIAKRDYIVK